MGIIICADDSFRCAFESVSAGPVHKHKRTDPDLIIIVVSGILWGLWFISTQVSLLKRRNQEMAMQISLLNNDCEKILKELEKMKKEK